MNEVKSIALLLGLWLGLASPARSVQDPATQEATDQRAADIAALIRKARTGRSVIRPQAARRLAGLGDDAGRALLAAAGESTADLAALGKDLIEVAGVFALPELRTRLWEALGDSNFPWRPSAAIGLTAGPQAAELPAFQDLLKDPLPAVRNAAVQAIGVLDARGAQDLLITHLAQETDGRVRRTLASLLDGWGERWALWYLHADLRREGVFFGQPTGRMSRLAAYPLLMQRLGGDDLGFRAADDLTTPENQAALAKLDEAVRQAAGESPELPPMAIATPPIADERLGLELRSCRRGEFFLRWSDSDELLVGRESPARIALEPGSVGALAALAKAQGTSLGDKRLFGVPGCDQETFHLRGKDGRDSVLLVSKGPEPVAGLRPAALGGLAEGLLATLPTGPSPDPRLDQLRSRVQAALESIGGATSEK